MIDLFTIDYQNRGDVPQRRSHAHGLHPRFEPRRAGCAQSRRSFGLDRPKGSGLKQPITQDEPSQLNNRLLEFYLRRLVTCALAAQMRPTGDTRISLKTSSALEQGA